MASIFAGLQSQTIDFFIADSSSTTGGGRSGLLWNTASITAYYRKGPTGASTPITLATQTVGGAWTSGGFVEIDATNMTGDYRFDPPNAMVDTEVMVTLHLQGAANMAPMIIRIDCRPLPSDVKKWLTVAPLALTSQRVETLVGAMANNVLTAAAINADAITDAKVADDVTIGSVTGAVGSVSAAIVLPTIPVDWITASGIATDAIGSAELADSAITEIQSGLATPTNVSDAQTAILAKLPAALVSGRMDSSVGAMAANVLTAAAMDATAANEIMVAILDELTANARAI